MNFHFTWREKVDSGNRLVANCHLTFNCTDVESLEAAAVFENGSVRSSDSEFNSGELGHDAEETHLGSDGLHGIRTNRFCQHLFIINLLSL